MNCTTLLVATLVGAVQGDLRAHLPPALQRLIEARTASTYEVDWTLTHLDEKESGLVERYLTRRAGKTLLQTNYGDAKGQHRTTLKPGSSEAPWDKAETAGTYHSLLYENEIWHVQHGTDYVAGVATVTSAAKDRRNRPLDFATAGIGPWWVEKPAGNVLGLSDEFVHGFENAEFASSTIGQTRYVTGVYDRYAIEWQLDLNRGGCPVRADFYIEDKLAYSSVTDLHLVDGRWMPASIQYFLDGNSSPYKIIDVQKMSFDQPEHPKEITPNDIDVFFGTQLWAPDYPEVMIWAGDSMIPWSEYEEMLYIHGLRPDPCICEKSALSSGQTIEQYMEKLDQITSIWRTDYKRKYGKEPWLMTRAPDEKDGWDLYVAAFIKEHELDEPRVERAHDLLDRAKKLRDHYRRKNKSDQRKAEAAGDGAKLDHIAAIEERIFNRVLKRGLEKILPRDKRHEAD